MRFLIVDKNVVKEILLEGKPEQPLPGWSHEGCPYQGFARFEEYEDYIEMVQIYVNEPERKKGVGKKLIKCVERIARENDKFVVVKSGATAMDDNPTFYNFLTKLKYKKINENTWEKRTMVAKKKNKLE